MIAEPLNHRVSLKSAIREVPEAVAQRMVTSLRREHSIHEIEQSIHVNLVQRQARFELCTLVAPQQQFYGSPTLFLLFALHRLTSVSRP